MSQTLLKNCASDPKYFYAPQNSSDLKPVFLQIAQSINSLRIADRGAGLRPAWRGGGPT